MSSRFNNLPSRQTIQSWAKVMESWRQSVDWWLLWASLCSGLTLLFITLINVAGTGIHQSTSPTRYNATILWDFHIIGDLSTYLYNGGFNYTHPNGFVPAWNHRFYLNGACSAPYICLDTQEQCSNQSYPFSYFPSEEAHSFWPICFYTGIGHRIFIQDVLYTMDNYLYRNNSVFPEGPTYYGSLPPGTYSDVAGDQFLPPYTIATHTAFALYAASAVTCFLFLTGVAGVVIMRKLFKEAAVNWLNKSSMPPLIGLLLNLFPLVACFVAIVQLNVAANRILSALSDVKTEVGNFVGIGHPFLALAWTIIVLQAISTIIFFNRWRGGCKIFESNESGEDRRVNMRETVRRSVDDPPPPYE